MASSDTLPILLLDGGLGTSLQDLYNVRFSSSETPLWSSHLLISAPDVLLKLQSDFAAAGADILLTATYQASFEGFANTPRIDHDGGSNKQRHDGYTREEAIAYMRSAIRLARQASQRLSGSRISSKGRSCVALSLGAFGATTVPSTEYSGEYPSAQSTWQSLYKFHLERIQVFASDQESWNDIDLVAFETLPVIREIHAVRQVMQTLKDNGFKPKKYWISCVFPNEDAKLPDGSEVDQVIEELLKPGSPLPFAIGLNCTKLHRVRPLLTRFEQSVKKFSKNFIEQSSNESLYQNYRPYLVLYPDGADGLVYNTTTQTWDKPLEDGKGAKRTIEQSWDEKLHEIVQEASASGTWGGIIVGGCCKTTPEMIRRLRQRITVAC